MKALRMAKTLLVLGLGVPANYMWWRFVFVCLSAGESDAAIVVLQVITTVGFLVVVSVITHEALNE